MGSLRSVAAASGLMEGEPLLLIARAAVGLKEDTQVSSSDTAHLPAQPAGVCFYYLWYC